MIPSEPNYLPEALRKSQAVAGKPGVYVLNVRHDDWCAVFRGGDCNCEPEVDDPKQLTHKER